MLASCSYLAMGPRAVGPLAILFVNVLPELPPRNSCITRVILDKSDLRARGMHMRRHKQLYELLLCNSRGLYAEEGQGQTTSNKPRVCLHIGL